MERANEFQQRENLYTDRDGLGDIFAGLIILGFGIGVLTGLFWLGGAFVPVLYPVWQAAKKRQFDRHEGKMLSSEASIKRARLTQMLMIGVGLGLLLLGLVFFLILSGENFLPGLRSWLQEYFTLVMGGLAVVTFLMLGVISRAGRYILYAVLALAIFTAGYLVQASLGVAMMLLGGVLFLGGVIVLFRFLREFEE